MELTLLGTAAPEGLPRPGCPCAGCAASVGPHARAAAAVLVDGVLLLDATPGAGAGAARAGHAPSGIRYVLAARPEEAGPAGGPLPGLPPAARLPAGQRLATSSGHRVRAVSVDGPGTGYAVTGPDGARALYLPPGAAPAGPTAAVPGGEERADRADRGAERPYEVVLADVLGRPEALARLRASGAVGPGTDVIAVHLDHDDPLGAELARRCVAAGSRTVPDGTTVLAGRPVQDPAVPRRTLVVGGTRSGKSLQAERCLEAHPDVVYAATGGGRDGNPDWVHRVHLHRERRPAHWRTVETRDLLPLLAEDGPPLLIDCLASWLADSMEQFDAGNDTAWLGGGQEKLRARSAELAAAVRAARRRVVLVSSEVGSGVEPGTAWQRRYRDELGWLNAAVGGTCEEVLLVVAGQVLALKG
ncbi:bifunctional adenosylcobinamide kinase/adenosylcobinamide-phosphate guanylyltransferase [Streptomyces sp. A0592]|uniref:bifunctional adenosylcobinamide kinase/adenosylcobinamide-phosphate guanylyltransferase n=1 Tax=Streptomyces sp. A0592 TaxID=2563099 RepID=UPI00109EE29B|nr:bifunctional adenosylcobinamide kinase/adenosylcobinamide-phosphate guanylyltransferase [Streptomyces sp. A0592]THA86378.1 adenosylcobinamide kinase/adenosylcobinamide phosphate guanyltransferase [Streptomyces sp. A0592]